MATTRLIVEFSSSKDLVYQTLQKSIEKYIPSLYLSLNPSMVWIQKIMECYSNIINKVNTKIDAQLNFIEQLKSNHLWDVQQFSVKVCYLLLTKNMKFIYLHYVVPRKI